MSHLQFALLISLGLPVLGYANAVSSFGGGLAVDQAIIPWKMVAPSSGTSISGSPLAMAAALSNMTPFALAIATTPGKCTPDAQTIPSFNSSADPSPRPHPPFFNAELPPDNTSSPDTSDSPATVDSSTAESATFAWAGVMLGGVCWLRSRLEIQFAAATSHPASYHPLPRLRPVEP